MFNSIINENKRLKRDFLAHLSLREQQIYSYFINKIGYCAVPRLVPLLYLGIHLKLSRQKVRTSIKKLIKEGLLEQFTTHKDPEGHYYPKIRFSYFRLPQPYNLFRESSDSRNNQLLNLNK